MARLSKENIFQASFLLFIFFIPIYQTWSIRLLIVTILLSLVLIRKPGWANEMRRNAPDLLLYYGVLLVGMLYSEDRESGFAVLEKNLSFIMIPLLISRVRMHSKDQVIRLFVVFTSGVVVASVVCLGFAVWRDVYLNYQQGYFFDQFTAIIDSHPTYLAYYICFSIIFLLYLISYESPRQLQRVLIVAGILFLAFILMLTAGRSTFMSMLMMASFFFLKILFDSQPMKVKLRSILITVLLLVIILFQSPYSKRILPNFPNGRSASLEQIKGDSWERLELWRAAIQASPSLFAGVGTGDYNQVMNRYYQEHGLLQYAEVNFNAHNQFIQILFSNGIPGLIALLIMMFRPVYLSVRRQNIFGMLTFFPFLIYGISEVFLGRYQGIVFFVFLHQVFVNYFLEDSERLSIKSIQTS